MGPTVPLAALCRTSAFVSRRLFLVFDGAPPKPFFSRFAPPHRPLCFHFARSLSTASQPFMLKISLKNILPAAVFVPPPPHLLCDLLPQLRFAPPPPSQVHVRFSLTSPTCRLVGRGTLYFYIFLTPAAAAAAAAATAV